MVAGSVAVSGACAAARSSDGPLGSAVDAALDAVGLGDSTAVGDVKADDTMSPPTPVPPTVDDVPCDKTPAGTTGMWAEKSYPGRSAADLSRGVATVCGGPLGGPSGFCAVHTTWVRDGVVMVYCGGGAGGSARFVMPPTL